ncbi:hypothetical protein AJ79_00486 [Helicocarpus griseus UAMH5409]|uniref:Uncharacterized protein n=1 Tax=Helicocarpus griseus UAMH5409 TaxID=1447875 RepID=A0A2B7YCU7_9EURO|nr:hypothetical protein AJ79_00486 [Helicocarpus griseus UAMH5409]
MRGHTRIDHQADIDRSHPADGIQNPHMQEGSGRTTMIRSNKRKALGSTERLVAVQSNSPILTHIASLAIERRQLIFEHYQANFTSYSDAKTNLSSPNYFKELPFPFVGNHIPLGFNAHGNDDVFYRYMGRENFSELVDTFDRCKKDHDIPDIWVYGLMGQGKSHLLATMVYFLTIQGHRVVYLPDCRICCVKPVRYLQESLRFAWADRPDKTEKIFNLRTMTDVEDFLAQSWDCKVMFVIDQMDAFDDPVDSKEDRKATAAIKAWLTRCRLDGKSILGTSANNLAFLNITHRLSHKSFFPSVVLLKYAEMDAWWDHHKDIDLGGYTRDKVEDLTGKLPLLLDRCTEGGFLNFDCKKVADMIRQSQRFVTRMISVLHGCITESSVPRYIEFEHVDHRYFQEKDGAGYCSCEIVRDGVKIALVEAENLPALIEESARPMTMLISNTPGAGYFMEHAANK